MEEMYREIRTRVDGLKEIYDDYVLDEVIAILDEIEEEYLWRP